MAYNYDAAMKLFCDAYAREDKKVTYQELQETLGLEYPIGDKEHLSLTSNAVSRLKDKLKKEHGLTFASACKGKANSPELQYYTVSQVKGGPIQKKTRTANSDSEKTLDALSRDNQKLYEEVENLRLQNRNLLDIVSEANSNIEEYKTIIKSLMNLAGMDL